MAYVRGEAPGQGSLFPVSLEELIPADHLVRVIDAYIATLDLRALGFAKAQLKETGRPPYDPADLLKLYLYGYFQQIRSSRRLERECGRNIEVMGLLGRLVPDFKTIAEFRRLNTSAFSRVCRHFVQFCRGAGLIGGELVAIDGSKFQAVAAVRQVVQLTRLRRQEAALDKQIAEYLAQLEPADREETAAVVDKAALQAALGQLRDRQRNVASTAALMEAIGIEQQVLTESDARLMRTAHQGKKVAYNVQSAVDAAHGLIVHHEVTSDGNDIPQLEPMAKATQAVLAQATLTVVADAGYSHLAQIQACEDAGITPYVALHRAINSQGDGGLFDRTEFTHDALSDSFRCPNGVTLTLRQISPKNQNRIYAAPIESCAGCPLKAQCTTAKRRYVSRHDHEAASQRMTLRLAAAPDIMKQRAATVEHPFGHLKFTMMGNAGRFLLRGLEGARAEMALAVCAYNLKRSFNTLGASALLMLLR